MYHLLGNFMQNSVKYTRLKYLDSNKTKESSRGGPMVHHYAHQLGHCLPHCMGGDTSWNVMLAR